MKELRQAVKECLIFAERSTKTYGENVTNEKIDAWSELAGSKKLTGAEFRDSFMVMIDGQEDFPAWATLWLAHCRIKGARLTDPVVVGEENGVLELGERAACDALCTPYREIGAQEGPKALPMTTAGRTAVKERLKASFVKVEEKLLGRPEPRVRAEYVVEDDPVQQAAHDERRRAIETEREQIEQARSEA